MITLKLLLYTLIWSNCLEKLKIELGRKKGKKKKKNKKNEDLKKKGFRVACMILIEKDNWM